MSGLSCWKSISKQVAKSDREKGKDLFQISEIKLQKLWLERILQSHKICICILCLYLFEKQAPYISEY